MTGGLFVAWLAGWVLGPGTLATEDPGPELSRLEGQRTHRAADAPDGYVIDDVAGEGPPRVGVVERRGDRLWLVPASGPALELTGPLASPRIAGPRYKVWAMGDVDSQGRLHARRLGILRPPERPR